MVKACNTIAAAVTGFAHGSGWTGFADPGDIVGARAQEAVLPIRVRLWTAGGRLPVKLKVARA